MRVGQDLFVLCFEPPAALEALIADLRLPRTGPGVLLFADSVDLDRLAREPLEPQRALWTEVALGHACEAGGAAATAFHDPWLMLSRPLGDGGQPLADVEMTRFHAGCPGYDGPAAGRRGAATVRSHAGVPLADLEFELREPAAAPPVGLLRWVNRRARPDVTRPGQLLDSGLWLLEPDALATADVWRGHGRARLEAGLGWSGTVEGEAWYLGTTYSIDGGRPL
jgi:hypothetical protein